MNQPYQLTTQYGENLRQAIERLAGNYQINFAYVPELLERQLVEAADYSAADIESLLRQLLSGLPVQYRILSDDRILLRRIKLKDDTGSEQTLTINGSILDGTSGQVMMNVAIALDTLNLGTMSDEQGRFSLTLPVAMADRSVYIYHIGYKTKHLPVNQLGRNTTIRLQTEALPLDEILIIERLPSLSSSLQDGSIRIRGEGIEGGIAGQLAGKDLFRQVQLMAGVSAADDLSSDIKIRGSNADETLIILDGMPLYKVDHFYGVFSALNSSYIDEVRLYKNALPIQYGGRTGGMLWMQSADRIDQLEGKVDINLLSGALQINAPLSPSLGVSLSGRRSYTNVASSKLFDWVGTQVDNYTEDTEDKIRPELLNTVPDFGFSDYNGKLLFAPNDRHRLALNLYHSSDKYLNSYSNASSRRFNQERIYREEAFEEEQEWKNLGASLQYQASLPNNWQLESDLFYTDYRFGGGLMASIISTAPRETRDFEISNDQQNQVENAGYRLLLNKKTASGNLLQLGTSLNQYQTAFAVTSEVDTLLSSKGNTYDAQVFANYRWAPVDRLQVDIGGRMNYYKATQKLYPAPRISATYLFKFGLALKSSYSVNYQFIRELTHENRLGQSVDLILLSDDDRFPVGQSTNYMLGGTYHLNKWFFDLELYHKDQANVIDHSSVNLDFGDEPIRPAQSQNYRIFVGEGNVNGLDATIGWEYTHYTGHLAYTLSKATNSFPGIFMGKVIPSRDDRRHQLKWINTFTTGRFEFSGNLIYSSGRPYYNLARIPRELGDRRESDPDLRRIVSWLPAYFRVDLGAAYGFMLGGTKAKLGLSVFNITNNSNVKYLQYIYSDVFEVGGSGVNTINGSQTDLLDRTLNLSFELEF
ncbi:MAG: carboxypeptidase-like regulatory domain-containing protein [Saprospiraceae bacterium]|nr:carboxypeptidase-like regulatory domain-containing protein [Lewinella sp.]